jgi:hypothetical protein
MEMPKLHDIDNINKAIIFKTELELEKLSGAEFHFGITGSFSNGVTEKVWGFDPQLWNQNADVSVRISDVDNPTQFEVYSNSGNHKKTFSYDADGFDMMMKSVKGRLATLKKHIKAENNAC